MVVPLATGVSENDDYQRACGRRETPLQGTDSFGSLPANITTGHVAKTGNRLCSREAARQGWLTPAAGTSASRESMSRHAGSKP